VAVVATTGVGLHKVASLILLHRHRHRRFLFSGYLRIAILMWYRQCLNLLIESFLIEAIIGKPDQLEGSLIHIL
jgi:hypothetical protein